MCTWPCVMPSAPPSANSKNTPRRQGEVKTHATPDVESATLFARKEDQS